jgi:hypothetical protein
VPFIFSPVTAKIPPLLHQTDTMSGGDVVSCKTQPERKSKASDTCEERGFNVTDEMLATIAYCEYRIAHENDWKNWWLIKMASSLLYDAEHEKSS